MLLATSNDFINPVVYKVSAADGSEQDWTVKVTEGNSDKLITAFSLPAETAPAVIDSAKDTVTMSVYSGTDLTNQVATFTLSDGATAQVGSTAQVSGITPNNFANPVVYKVTAADGSEQDWTVTVNEASSAKLITSYSLPAETGSAVINSTNDTVTMSVYSGTDLTNQVATFTLSDGATAQVGSTSQVSGVTANDFTNPIVYKVTAADGSEQDWAVTAVSTAPILVTGITITGAEDVTSVVYGSTLQMSAAVLPTNATNQSVTWSVTPVTGAATINATSGLLTGIGTGTVKVTAMANDGSGVTGSLQVTVTPASAINMVSASPTSNTAGTATAITVNVATIAVVDGTTVTTELVNASDGGSLSPTVSTSGTISSNAATLTLNVPSTVAAGSYKIKVTVGSRASALTDSGTAYTCSNKLYNLYECGRQSCW